MTHLITLLTFVVSGFSATSPVTIQNQAVFAVANASAGEVDNAVRMPEVIVTAPRVPADSVDLLIGKYRPQPGLAALGRSLAGYGFMVVAGIFALVWIVLVISGMAAWPREPRIPHEQPKVHIYDVFQHQPVAVYDIRKKRLDALRRRRS